ncbi:MAG: polysaccharide deacetylase family protein [Gemmatimonadota bacterium]|nr:MAG: polysaccharide deacetylase family protein [Gemmatimonadota bacterium]
MRSVQSGMCLALILLSGCGWRTHERAHERTLVSFEAPGVFTRVSPAGIVDRGSGEPPHLSCKTPGDGSAVVVVNSRPYDPPLDFTNRFLRVRIRVDRVMGLTDMEFHLFSDAQRTQALVLRIPLFADERANLLQDGEWITVTLSPGAARRAGNPDRSAIREIVWLVADNGSPDSLMPVRADLSELAAVDATRGIVTLTFDDGYEEHYSAAAPLMAEHGLRGTAYVMPDQVGEPGYMTLEQLHELQHRYGWDVAAHHMDPFTDLGSEVLEAVIIEMRGFLEREGFEGAEHLAYPLGKYDARTVLPLVQRYFTTARLASGGPETLPPADPYRLRAVNILPTTEPEEIAAAALRADQNGEWLILMFHSLVESPERDTDYGLAEFARTIELLADGRIDVRPFSEVWKDYGRNPPAPDH